MTSLTLVRRIAARPSVVFDAVTTSDGIACWWGPDDGPVLVAETDIRVGGRFRVRFRMLSLLWVLRRSRERITWWLGEPGSV